MSDLREELSAYHFATRVQTGSETHGGSPQYAYFCVKCHEVFPCLVVRALEEGDAECAEWLAKHEERGRTLWLREGEINSLLTQLAEEQGRHRACEEIIARTRELAWSYARWEDKPGDEGAVPVSEILAALGPEPKPW